MKSSTEMIDYYRELQSFTAGSSMLREIEWQYIDMAQGGDGGSLGSGVSSEWEGPRGWPETSCRGINYPQEPDAFFQEVCDGMGWKWRESQ